MHAFARFLPFLRWFPLKGDLFKADFIAGVTVALVLIPQSMAYAQLAGMPAYYGLYAAFLPVAVAALFGSSNFLGTGPVAVVSLLTASSLAVLAPPGSDQFIALAILLTLMVGVFQLSLGVLKLGVIVNFLSHPVIVGFTNAAAIIIGLSQVSKLFGVSMGRSENFMKDIWGVMLQLGETHLPTLAMGVGAIVIMWALKKFRPKWPGVLIAVVLATVISWAIGFERNLDGKVEELASPQLKAMVTDLMAAQQRQSALEIAKSDKTAELLAAEKVEGHGTAHLAELEYDMELATIAARSAAEEVDKRKKALRKIAVVRVPGAEGASAVLYMAENLPAGLETDGHTYRVRKVSQGKFKLVGGGEVVGSIPEGLPSVSMPSMNLDAFVSLLSAAIVISLVGFMEAISIAKALAAKAKQKVDPNQELIGQGLANIAGSLTQSFPASGSFSRSAVNFNAGARSGMASVITATFVLITLLFLTPLLYHLPQAVLAAIIIMAVIGLVNFEAIKHAWLASRHDGVAAGITFVATLLYAPHLDNGILVGAGLAILLYLYRTMRPRVAILGRYPDGTLRDIKVHPNLPTSEHVVAMRFDGSLYFANIAFFEDAVLEAVADNPNAKYVLIVGDAVNQMDASGEEVVHHLVSRLREGHVEIVFSGFKKQILDVMRATGLFELVGQHNIFATEDQALTAIYERLADVAQDDLFCVVKPTAAPAAA
ncbi:MAG: SulP family inorganic anion transporter [Pseudomonadota bacterium]|nr:SulP family inorganic anion transporter [Pseudomonadota bacterium]MDP1906407.1 SulP family inorganic anion transporter [Pseudomonadota bacterium]MDP2351458.1 SulP family inorganic anion transporter [Pseudomonadota bacterium]